MTEPAGLLRELVELLDRLGIQHMVVGSFASTFHGEPRTTRDLDLVIDPSAPQLEALLGALPDDRYYVDPDVARDALQRRTMFNVIDMTSAWKLDLVIRKSRPFSIEELRRRQPATILDVPIKLATAEDTIIAKLEWAKASGSERQLEDIAGIVRVRGETSLDREYLEHWVSELGLATEWAAARARVD